MRRTWRLEHSLRNFGQYWPRNSRRSARHVEELAGEATTRDAEDTALRVLLEEVRASIADFATRPWCEQGFSAIREKLSEKPNEVMMVIKQEAQEREAADLNL